MTPVDVKKRRVAAANSKWRVYFDHIADTRGNEVLDYLVLEAHKQRPDATIGVCILPIVDGKFVLLSCYRHALGVRRWEAPRGFIEADENPLAAALRELTEETGLKCKSADMVALGCYTPEPSTMAARGALFAATNCEGTLRLAMDEIGLLGLRAFEPDEVVRMAAKGEIEDAGTLISYFRFTTYSGQKRPRTNAASVGTGSR
jgi:8-oxo-dGTP pyrophosphatase MutT (NUDIX family)